MTKGKNVIILLITAIISISILFFIKYKSIAAADQAAAKLIPASAREAVGITAVSPPYTSIISSGSEIYDNELPYQKHTDSSENNIATPVEENGPVLFEYNGAIRHIFFHPLIIYPEMAFDGDSIAQGYNEWFVTVREFNKILHSLYSKNYILVDMEKLYETKEQNGKRSIVKKKLMLPEGKKPLIISVDDLNYYDYMKENGNAHKLVIDNEGNAAAYSVSPEGQEKVDRNSEIVPIIDQFVEQHPDFSLDGAKGIIALTGYAGILGYHTEDPGSKDYAIEKEEALKVVERLKETGWSFASHGYGHLHSNKVTFDRLKKDTEKWKADVESLIGPTDIYIYPYGEEIPIRNPKFQMLMSEGFNIFCPVGNTGFQIAAENYVQMDRMNIDGTAFFYRKEKLSDMFDVDDVVDALRPPLKK